LSGISSLRDKMHRILSEAFSHVRLDGEYGFLIPFENVSVKVFAYETEDPDRREWLEEHDLPTLRVIAQSVVLREVPRTSELFQFVSEELPLSTSAQIWLDPDQEDASKCFVNTYQRISGDSLDPNELLYSVMTVLWDSERVGTLVLEKFDGLWQATGAK
jgi:hypothetical protein